MTDDEIRRALDAHPEWSKRRQLAFVEKNLEFDVEAEQRRQVMEVLDTAFRDGVLIREGDRVRASGQIGPADVLGLAGIALQHYDLRERRELLERAARDGLLIRGDDGARLAGDMGPRDVDDIVRILAQHYKRRRP
jgi:hypothetical protein